MRLSAKQNHALAEPFAFAFLTWPAVVALYAPTLDADADILRIGLYLWLTIMHLAAYTRGRGAGFGNLVLLMSGCVALACQMHPSAWALAWLPVLLVGLHAAQRARLNRSAEVGELEDPGSRAGADPDRTEGSEAH